MVAQPHLNTKRDKKLHVGGSRRSSKRSNYKKRKRTNGDTCKLFANVAPSKNCDGSSVITREARNRPKRVLQLS